MKVNLSGEISPGAIASIESNGSKSFYYVAYVQKGGDREGLLAFPLATDTESNTELRIHRSEYTFYANTGTDIQRAFALPSKRNQTPHFVDFTNPEIMEIESGTDATLSAHETLKRSDFQKTQKIANAHLTALAHPTIQEYVDNFVPLGKTVRRTATDWGKVLHGYDMGLKGARIAEEERLNTFEPAHADNTSNPPARPPNRQTQTPQPPQTKKPKNLRAL